MNYKDEVVSSSIQGLKDGGLAHAEVFRALLERVYECGYSECIRNIKEKEVLSRYSDLISNGGMDPR